MMSVGIKNAILLLLIIMILHFLIMNLLLEKTSSSKKNTEAFKEDAHETFVKGDETNKKQDDLMAYVSSNNDFEEYVDANEANFEKNMPVVCDTKTLMKDDEPVMKVPKKDKRHSDTINNNFLVIQEYEDESSLNGGKVFDGLCGYDEYGDTYQSI